MLPYHTPRPFPYSSSYISLYPYTYAPAHFYKPLAIYPFTSNHYHNTTTPPSYPFRDTTDPSEHYLSIGQLKTVYSIHRLSKQQNKSLQKNDFYTLVASNIEEAMNQINDEQISFSSLFQLRDAIHENNLFEGLNQRNKTALILVDDILSHGTEKHTIDLSFCDYIQSAHTVLKWILETGAVHDGLSSDHDAVLDIAAALLVKLFHEKSVLPIMADMIFERNRKGRFNHDLVWAFFEAKEPESLILIANRLKSENQKDVEFAHKLLNFIPDIGTGNMVNADQQYSYIVHWLQDNGPFLHYTGESLQQLHRPSPYVVILEAKYLCKPLYANKAEVAAPLSSKDYQLLDAYSKLDLHHKILLSNYSLSLHRQNLSWWKSWLQYPVTEQIKIAKVRTGGRL